MFHSDNKHSQMDGKPCGENVAYYFSKPVKPPNGEEFTTNKIPNQHCDAENSRYRHLRCGEVVQ